MKNKTYIIKWSHRFAIEIKAKNKKEAEKKWQENDYNKKDIENIDEFHPAPEIVEE